MNFLDDQKLITFDEKLHKYYTKDGKELMSVTRFIELFTNPFDPDGSILKNKAQKLNLEPSALKNQWDRKRDDAASRGTIFHYDFNQYLRKKIIPKGKNGEIIKKLTEEHPFKGKVYSEVVLFNDFICGTADIIEVIKDGTINIKDFKSNEKLSTYSFGKYMFPPLNHIPDGKVQRYELQINIYLYLLCSKYDFWPGIDNCIFWVKIDKGKVEKIPVPLRVKEVEDMIEFYKRGLM